MAIPYNANAMLTPVKSGIYQYRPFLDQGDSVTTITEDEFVVHRTGYEAGNLGDVHPEDPNSFLVGEGKPRAEDGDLIRYKKTYSQVPQTRVEFEPYVFTTPTMEAVGSPALVNNSPLTVQWNQSYVDNTTGLTQYGTKITFAAGDQPHGINDGDIVKFKVSYNYNPPGPTPASYGQIMYVIREVHEVDSPTDSYIITDNWFSDFFDIAGQWGEVVEQVFSGTYVDSTGKAKIVTSEVQVDYFHTVDPSGIPILDSLTFYDGSNERTNTLNATSTPTADEYAGWVANGTRMIVEPSRVTRWKGNIWERKTRYIKATV